MRLAVIPARGGSKRIPRKNIKLFHGKPMIEYAINVAITSELFDKVIVSTDDLEIAEIAKLLGAHVPFMRPTNLSDDNTATAPVIVHAIKACQNEGLDVTEVCCIYPSVPFLLTNDLRNSHKTLLKSTSKYVFSVTRFPSPIQRALIRFPDDSVKPFFEEYVQTRTQDLEQCYFDVGQFYWGMTTTWFQEQNIHLNGLGFEIPEWRAVDVDTPEDWERAELLYSMLSKN
jgi:pseudaminic acid cytidylyltransferase